jgi:hypothetical protein
VTNPPLPPLPQSFLAFKNIKNEHSKNLLKEIETTFKTSNSKPKTSISANIEDEVQKIEDSKKNYICPALTCKMRRLKSRNWNKYSMLK